MNNDSQPVGVSPGFAHGVRAILDYWCRQTAGLYDGRIRELNPDFPNLLQAIEVGLLLPETQQQTAGLILQCFFWVEGAGHVHQWQAVVSRAAAVVPASDLTLRFRLLKQLGQLQQIQWQLDEAISTIHVARELAERLEDNLAVAETHLYLCQVYRRQHVYSRAQTHGQMALALWGEESSRFVAVTMQVLGQIAQEQGDLVQAKEWLQRALAVQHELKTITDVTRTMNLLAIVLQQQGNFEDALRNYQEICALLAGTENIKDKVEAYINQGTVYYDQRELNQAEAALRKAEELAHAQPSLVYQRGLIANNLGCIFRERQEWLAADAYFRQSVTLFRQIGSDLMLANSLGNWAKSDIRRGHTQEVLPRLDQVLQLVANYPESVWARDLQLQYSAIRDNVQGSP